MSTAPDLWILESGASRADVNMAMDEALLVTAADRGRAVLRFYGWTEPAATFGYFQRLSEVERTTSLRPLVRRPTGGGIVPHDHDWTYSLAVPPCQEWYGLKAVDSYQAMHRWVVDAFARTGIEAELAPCCRTVAPGQCFQGWEKFDVLRLGRKIGGAAQRRNRLGLLIQGSVQPPPGASRPAWQEAMRHAAPTAGFATVAFLEPEAELDRCAAELVRARYSRPEYNGQR